LKRENKDGGDRQKAFYAIGRIETCARFCAEGLAFQN